MDFQIIVEDGSNVAGANSYVALDEVRAYCIRRGQSIPESNEELAVMLIKSCDYLQTFALEYKGVVTNVDQSLQWPRSDVYLYGNSEPFPFDKIPKELKNSQCSAIVAIANGVDLMPNATASDFVVREKVGVIETEYADPSKLGASPTLTEFNALIAPLLNQSGGMAISTRRV